MMADDSPSQLADATCLVVGAGGIGVPASWALAAAGLGRIVLLDDDRIESSNLHRQILFAEENVGQPKAEVLAGELQRRFPRTQVEVRRARAIPETVETLVGLADIVLDGTDNFASRFLLADACWLGAKAVVHAASVRWLATCLVSDPAGRPCYRCLFEDIPEGKLPDCTSVGVVGPVCGVAAAMAVDAVVRWIRGEGKTVVGTITRFDGQSGSFRQTLLPARASCSLCGTPPQIFNVVRERYTKGKNSG